MITNIALANAMNEERRHRAIERHRLGTKAGVELHTIRQAAGRWLESLGRWMQDATEPRPLSL